MSKALQEGYKDFKKDIARAKKTELAVASIIEKRLNCKAIEFRDDNKYDIAFERNSDGSVFTVEVKEDFGAHRTGNIAVEYSCRGKDSGVLVSNSDYYLYRVHTSSGIKHFIMRTPVLKRSIEDKEYFRTVNGGDEGSNSLCYLFKIATIERISLNLHTENSN